MRVKVLHFNVLLTRFLTAQAHALDTLQDITNLLLSIRPKSGQEW